MTKGITVMVLTPELVPLGLVNSLMSFKWTSRVDEFNGFTMWAPITKDNSEMIRRGNLVYLSEEKTAVIETVQQSISEQGPYLQVSGRDLRCWLARRIVWDNASATDKVSNIMRNLVDLSAINPSVPDRVLPFLKLDDGQQELGETISYESLRGNLWDSLYNLAQQNNLLQEMTCSLNDKEVIYRISQPVDRSIEQTQNQVVVLSTEFDDVLSSSYTADETDFYNVALVQGAARSTIVNPHISGESRRELFVDASDLTGIEVWDVEETIVTTRTPGASGGYKVVETWLATDLNTKDTHVSTHTEISSTYVPSGEQEILEGSIQFNVVTKVTELPASPDIITVSSTKNMTSQLTGEKRTLTSTTQTSGAQATVGTEVKTYTEDVPLPIERYEAQLQERGRVELLKQRLVEGFEFNLKTFNVTSFVYGKDYFLGDRITVQDQKLGIQVSTVVTSAEEVWDDVGYSLILHLGTSAPTITQILRRVK